MKRGELTKEVNEVALSFLGREITIEELRVYPYLDYILKNHFEYNFDKIKDKEIPILDKLEEEFHILYNRAYFRCTKEFYDYIQQVLSISYVPDFISSEDMKSLTNRSK